MPPAPDAFVLQGKLRHGELLVEFLRPTSTLFPPVNARLASNTGEEELPVRVFSPEELLAKKVALATDVPQEGVEGEFAP